MPVLTTLDLFCGAGGLTEGFRQAGYECLYGLDSDESALETFRCNHPTAVTDCTPVEQVDAGAVRRALGLVQGELSSLIGGPPCQGFSINAPDRFIDDPRNALFRHYMRFVDEFRPQTLVFENVPGMLSLARGAVFHQILREFEKCGYQVSAKILFAAHYGVPQERWRLIMLGSRVGSTPVHPLPTHYASGRANFTGAAAMSFRLGPIDEFVLRPRVTVADALSGLPRLSMGQGGEVVEYAPDPMSEYAQSLRNPAGHTFNHFAARLSKKNVERMKHVGPGGSWRDIPRELLPPGMQRARTSDHTKRYGRLKADELAGTVMTKCDPHWGAVFLPDQDRTLTVREAARLQSFPDAYRFCGSRASQYRQVGNAVPVLLGRAIAGSLKDYLCSISARSGVM